MSPVEHKEKTATLRNEPMLSDTATSNDPDGKQRIGNEYYIEQAQDLADKTADLLRNDNLGHTPRISHQLLPDSETASEIISDRYAIGVYSHQDEPLLVVSGKLQILADLDATNLVELERLVSWVPLFMVPVLPTAHRWEVYRYHPNKTLTAVFYRQPYDAEAQEHVRWGE